MISFIENLKKCMLAKLKFPMLNDAKKKILSKLSTNVEMNFSNFYQ